MAKKKWQDKVDAEREPTREERINATTDHVVKSTSDIIDETIDRFLNLKEEGKTDEEAAAIIREETKIQNEARDKALAERLAQKSRGGSGRTH